MWEKWSEIEIPSSFRSLWILIVLEKDVWIIIVIKVAAKDDDDYDDNN